MNKDEILFEATSRNAQTFEGCTLRLYESGLYQKITYDKSDSLESSKTEITVIGEKPEAVTEVKKLFKNNSALRFEAYVKECEELIHNNPYADSELTYVKFGPISCSGKNLFTIFSDEELKKIDPSRKNAKAYHHIRTISRHKSETVILLQKLFEN